MTKKKGLKVGSMSDLSEEEIRMSGICDTHYYSYRCRDCGYEAKVEDMTSWWILFRLPPGQGTACLNCNVFVVVTSAMSKIFKARTEGAICSCNLFLFSIVIEISSATQGASAGVKVWPLF